MRAVYKAHPAIVTILLAAKANVAVHDNDGNTALIWAARNDDANLITLLIEKKANVFITNNLGRTALDESHGESRKIIHDATLKIRYSPFFSAKPALSLEKNAKRRPDPKLRMT